MEIFASSQQLGIEAIAWPGSLEIVAAATSCHLLPAWQGELGTITDRWAKWLDCIPLASSASHLAKSRTGIEENIFGTPNAFPIS